MTARSLNFGGSAVMAIGLGVAFAAAVSASPSEIASTQRIGDQPSGEQQTTAQASNPNRFSGNISWYGVPFNGRRTASGRIFDMHKLTCAHRTLPFGTKILVQNPKNGRSVIVEVIDRGPFVRMRVMDLSREAARQLGTLTGGISYVNCLVITELPPPMSLPPSEPVTQPRCGGD